MARRNRLSFLDRDFQRQIRVELTPEEIRLRKSKRLGRQLRQFKMALNNCLEQLNDDVDMGADNELLAEIKTKMTELNDLIEIPER